MSELSGALKDLRDASSGRSIVREVLRTDAAFPGARLAYLPDLIVLWDNAAPITSVTSARLGTLSMASPDSRTGTHTGPGFLVASGGSVQRRGELREASIVDFAPTMLALAGVDAPSHMRGKALSELIAV